MVGDRAPESAVKGFTYAGDLLIGVVGNADWPGPSKPGPPGYWTGCMALKGRPKKSIPGTALAVALDGVGAAKKGLLYAVNPPGVPGGVGDGKLLPKGPGPENCSPSPISPLSISTRS